jgi:hypothetical protein
MSGECVVPAAENIKRVTHEEARRWVDDGYPDDSSRRPDAVARHIRDCTKCRGLNSCLTVAMRIAALKD